MSPQDYTQDDRWLSIRTPLGKDVLLLKSIDGEERISGLFRYRLDLLSTDPNIDARRIIGKSVTVRMLLANGGERYFDGYVQRFEFSGTGDRLSMYQAEIVPWTWFLTQRQDCRIFEDQRVPDIIRKVLSSYDSAKVDMSALSEIYPVREYCVQYRESDFDFISRLMEEYGIYYYFKHLDGQHVMVIGDAPSGYGKAQEDKIRRYNSFAIQDLRDDIRSWNHQWEFRQAKYSHIDYNFKTSRSNLETNHVAEIDLPDAPQYEVFDSPGRYIVTGDGASLAKVRAEQQESAYERVTASTICRSFGAGLTFTVSDHHEERESGTRWVITRIHHRASQDGAYLSGGDFTNTMYLNEFDAIPARRTFRPARVTPKPVIRGAQTATVFGPSSQEIFTDKYARIKVLFHWDRGGRKKNTASCWIRVAQPTAGKSWGTLAIPRVGHEVLVHFLEGDPDQPLVMGSIYNDINVPPCSHAGAKSRSDRSDAVAAAMMTTIRSNSLGGSGGHNEITMNDSGGQESLYIKAQKNEVHDVGNDREKNVVHDETTDIGHDRTEKVGNDEMVTIGNNRTHSVGSNDSLSVGSNRTETVGMMSSESVGLVKSLQTGAAYLINVGAAMNTVVAMIQSEEVGQSKSSVVGKNYTIDAGESFEVVCGSGKFRIEKSGKITFEGTSFEVKTSGAVKVNGSTIDLN